MTALSPENAQRLRLAFQESRDNGGTLKEQVSAYAAATREIFPAYAEAIDRLAARVRENGGAESAPKPGEQMPRFILPDESGRLIDLEALLHKGPLVVMFFRGQWCPFCRLSIRAVTQAYDRIKAQGAQVIAITPEVQEFSNKLKAEANAPFPVLTDLDNGYALSLNLTVWLGGEIRQLISHQPMAKFHGNDGWLLPIPATFILDREGIIKTRFIDPDFRKRVEISDLITAVQSAGSGS